MRKVGVVNSQEESRKLIAAFHAKTIDIEVHEDDASYTFWLLDDERMEESKKLLSLLKTSPNDDIFKSKAPPEPREKLSLLEKRAGMDRARHVDVRSEIFDRVGASDLYVTFSLIGACILLTLISKMLPTASFVRSLYFSEYMGRDFPEILNGEVWRMITPIFLHGDILHLLFNMMWLYQLGSSIERIEKPWYLALLVVGLGTLCNIAQYLVSGPLFIGMSGVVYGLLGYIWLMSLNQYRTRYFISQGTVTFMLIWLVVCLVGIIPNVANTQHVAGILLGSAWGYLRAKSTG
jgi:GlpG protein